MIQIHHISVRALGLSLMGLSMAALLSVAAPQSAQAGQPHWDKGHGYEQGGRHWRKGRQHRKAHRRAHRKADHWESRRHHRSHRPYRDTYAWGSSGSGDFLSGITGGHLLGGLLGAATGTQFGKGRGRIVAVLGGAILGAVLGNEVSKSIRDNDRRQAQSTLESTPTGQTVSWRNPDTGARYNITPTGTYRGSTGRYCREYSTWVFIDGYEEKAFGTACRAPDGAWVPVAQ